MMNDQSNILHKMKQNQRISFSGWRCTITDSSPKEERFQPHTCIDFEAEKAAKRLAESRCQDVTFTVVIPAGLTTTKKRSTDRDEMGLLGHTICF